MNKVKTIAIFTLYLVIFFSSISEIYAQQTALRKRVFTSAYDKDEIVDSTQYLFQIAKLYEMKDDTLLRRKQIEVYIRETTTFDKINYWNNLYIAPSNNPLFNYSKNKSKIKEAQKADQLPYPTYSYSGTDPIIKSPMSNLWTPLRKGIMDLDRSVGLYVHPLALTYYGVTPSALEGKANNTGFFGIDIYSNWLISNSEKWGVTSISFEIGYIENIANNNPDLGGAVGSNIISNVTATESVPIVGDFYITKTFFKNRLIAKIGRITPWYYYGFNTFADDELTRFANSLINGGTYLPEGGGNATKPGFAIQYLISDHFYFNFVITNPSGEDADLDFSVYNKNHHFAAAEVGYIYTLSKQLEGRLSFGLHHGLKQNIENQNGYNGFGFNLLLQQELTPKGYTPYVGTFAQISYSDPNISNVKQQYSAGMNIDHFMHRRNDGLGVSMGVAVPSNINFRTELFVNSFYRLQLTESSQLTIDAQLYINAANPEQHRGIASVYSLRYLFSI